MATDPPAGRPGRARSRRTGGVRRRGAALVGAALAASALVTACGAPPDYQYVASSDRMMVVKMPRSWTSVDPAAVGATAGSGRWLGFYDASGNPRATDFTGELPISAPDSPVVRLLSVKIDPNATVLADDLRDIFAPNSAHEVAKLETSSIINDTRLVGYKKLSETAVKTSTASGLRVVSGYAFEKDPDKDRLVSAGFAQADPAPPTVVVDKLALVSRDHRYLHVIAVWCNLACFQKNQKQIDEVMSTYTVKLQP